MGASCNSETCGGQFSATEKELHINTFRAEGGTLWNEIIQQRGN